MPNEVGTSTNGLTQSRHQPIAVLSVLSFVGGAMGFAKAGSVPSLAAGVGIGAAMAVSAMRIHDSLPGGLEMAAGSSAVMFVPMLRRALRTRSPIPITMSILAGVSAGFYGHEAYDEYEHRLK
ncbi:hypothetical protein CC85DRAFT_240444 [Cutaneotrichosporon oleaginosum]|uniref:Transmembrane protein 14C n=1 Tax=Cutaneotrichosporon oleaginosum TaxID=879819 RepID=A0A0J1BC88_9TREE|nr:uncharacterized protein CC85DRAFT_240444 [Cutaneotrichosporon oleaginosum]KLT45639.1 hypothetical protein CC85DRAFT_240444 [Cutaneotrichosporon oleaginosum]TXT04568.1 hypothetical protein COLE_07387 [Cutaneotrichosporon oleaginosum]